MRNLLEEFQSDHGLRPATILGVREHVFTGRYVWLEFCNSVSYFDFILVWILLSKFSVTVRSVSSLASFMSNQETSFVTLGQRVLANPLK